MKTKLSLVALGLMLNCVVVSDLAAQGRINFSNSSATPIRISNGTTTVILGTASTASFGIGPASTRIQLYASLNSSELVGFFPSVSPVLIGTGANQSAVTNTASVAGFAQGTFPGGAVLPLAGFDGSQPVYLKFTGLAINGMFWGESPIIQVNLATGSDPATEVFSTTADGSHWNGLTIGVPEPSALALVGVSGWLMFLARRRR